MSRALLDVNVLIALLDSDHIEHRTAQAWMAANADEGWASCAITENGFVRIISQPRYPNPVTTTHAIALLGASVSGGLHQHWPSDISLLDDEVIDPTRLLGPRQVTDAYLLALAVRHAGRLITFDTGVPVAAVRGAAGEHLVVI